MFAYLWSAIAEEYSRDHLFYLFEAMVLNFFKSCIKIPRETGLVWRFLFVDTENRFLKARKADLTYLENILMTQWHKMSYHFH